MKSIVLLSGPVGAGKSTVAKELLALTSHPIAYIEGDAFWSFFARSGEMHGPARNFKVIMTSMIAAALPYARAEYETIVDFSVPPWFLETAQKVIKERVPLDYVILRPSESVCAARAASRAEGAITDYSRYRELYSDFEVDERYTLEDVGEGASVIAGRVREGLDAGKFRVV
jgi:adenylate kinase family enzyme